MYLLQEVETYGLHPGYCLIPRSLLDRFYAPPSLAVCITIIAARSDEVDTDGVLCRLEVLRI